MAERFTSISGYRRSSPRSRSKPKKSSTSSVIIVIFIFVVIIGSFLLFKKKPKIEEDVSESVEEVEEEILGETSDIEQQEKIDEVVVTEKSADSEAEVPPGEFSKDNQEVGDAKIEDIVVANLDHKGFESFFRIIFTIESDDGLPRTVASIDEGSNLISLKIYGVGDDKTGIRPGGSADVTGSVVSSIFHQVTSDEKVSYYSIGIKVSTGFALQVLEDSEKIILDIQEQEIENGDGEVFEFSKEDQSIAGNAADNVAYIEGISHSDQGNAFRITYRMGSIGTGNIPTTTAKLVDYEGGRAIKVVISKLYNDYIAKNEYDVEYGNVVVSGMVGTYANHSSTYFIKLNAEREFKLHYTTAPAYVMLDVKR